MSNTYHGVGVKFGVPGSTVAWTGFGARIIDSASLKREADKYEIKNETGNMVGMVYSNHRTVVTLEVTPSAATLANAAIANVVPTIGTLVTVVSTGATADDQEYGATTPGTVYVVDAAEKKQTSDGPSKLSLTLTTYDTAGATTVISS